MGSFIHTVYSARSYFLVSSWTSRETDDNPFELLGFADGFRFWGGRFLGDGMSTVVNTSPGTLGGGTDADTSDCTVSMGTVAAAEKPEEKFETAEISTTGDIVSVSGS